jgi:hypothetical protein
MSAEESRRDALVRFGNPVVTKERAIGVVASWIPARGIVECEPVAAGARGVKALLVAQGLDGVEVGGFPGGVDAEKKADGAGNAEAYEDPQGG